MPSPPPASARRRVRAAVAAAAVALVAACGGGTSLVDPFEPTRMVVFGDELSVLDDSGSPGNGRKYTINSVKADKVTIDCAKSLLWTQFIAIHYRLVLPGCNPDDAATTSVVRAAAGATVADVVAQIDAQAATPEKFSGEVLATVLVGANDVLAEYRAVAAGTRSAEAAEDRVEAAGERIVRRVVAMAKAGAKVLIVTVPDMGLTPYAKGLDTAAGNTTASALLTHLSARFNARLRVTLPVDAGRSIGIVFADQLVTAVADDPSRYSVVETGKAGCDKTEAPTTPQCTTETMVAAGADSSYMWADDFWFAPRLQELLGNAAVNQAERNPF